MASTLAENSRHTKELKRLRNKRTLLLTLSPEENAKTFSVRIGDVNAKPLVKTLPRNQPPAQAKENLDTLCYLMTYSLVDTKTYLNILNHLKAEILIDRLVDTLAEREAKTFATQTEMCRPRP